MRKILFVSNYGDGADIALRMAVEPNTEVLLWIEDPLYRVNFDGVLDKPKSWQDGARWADVIIFDDNACVDIWKKVHKSKPMMTLVKSLT